MDEDLKYWYDMYEKAQASGDQQMLQEASRKMQELTNGFGSNAGQYSPYDTRSTVTKGLDAVGGGINYAANVGKQYGQFIPGANTGIDLAAGVAGFIPNIIRNVITGVTGGGVGMANKYVTDADRANNNRSDSWNHVGTDALTVAAVEAGLPMVKSVGKGVGNAVTKGYRGATSAMTPQVAGNTIAKNLNYGYGRQAVNKSILDSPTHPNPVYNVGNPYFKGGPQVSEYITKRAGVDKVGVSQFDAGIKPHNTRRVQTDRIKNDYLNSGDKSAFNRANIELQNTKGIPRSTEGKNLQGFNNKMNSVSTKTQENINSGNSQYTKPYKGSTWQPKTGDAKSSTYSTDIRGSGTYNGKTGRYEPTANSAGQYGDNYVQDYGSMMKKFDMGAPNPNMRSVGQSADDMLRELDSRGMFNGTDRAAAQRWKQTYKDAVASGNEERIRAVELELRDVYFKGQRQMPKEGSVKFDDKKGTHAPDRSDPRVGNEVGKRNKWEGDQKVKADNSSKYKEIYSTQKEHVSALEKERMYEKAKETGDYESYNNWLKDRNAVEDAAFRTNPKSFGNSGGKTKELNPEKSMDKARFDAEYGHGYWDAKVLGDQQRKVIGGNIDKFNTGKPMAPPKSTGGFEGFESVSELEMATRFDARHGKGAWAKQKQQESRSKTSKQVREKRQDQQFEDFLNDSSFRSGGVLYRKK